MAMSIICPSCSTKLTASPDEVGKSIRCDVCGEKVTVPQAAQPLPAKPLPAQPLPAKPLPAKPLPAQPLPAKPLPAIALPVDEELEAAPRKKKKIQVDEDEEDARPAKALKRRNRSEDDEEDDAPRPKGRRRDREEDDEPKKSSLLPILLVAFALLVLIGGVGVAGIYYLTKEDTANKDSVKDTGKLPDEDAGKRPPPFPGAGFPPFPGTGPGPFPGTGVPPFPGTGVPPFPGTGVPPFPGTNVSPMPFPGTQPPVGPGPKPDPKPEPKPDPKPEPKPEPKPDPKPITKTDPDQATLNRAKQATVYLEVEDGLGGGGSGSGWLGIEPGLIFTNAHVIGMLKPGSKPPSKITAYLHAGQPGKQVTIPHARLRILAVDSDMDLALIQILGEKTLPTPLPVRASSTLRDLEKLTVLGFPGGRRLSVRNRNTEPPTVTINPTSVMRLVNDKHQNLYSVQISGGVVHGNSGGPIIDVEGNVVAVSVRVDLDNQGRFTNIAYGVPTEFVTGLVAGRPAGVELGQPYRKGDKVALPVTVRCLDPMERLRSVGIAGWIADSNGAPRPPGLKHVEETGDAAFHEVKLEYDSGKKQATGELLFPPAPPGRTYWTQVYYMNGLTDKNWLAGVPNKMPGAPLDAIAAELKVNYRPGSKRKITLSHLIDLEELEEGEASDRSERTLKETSVKMDETVTKAAASGQGSYNLLFAFDSIALKAKRGEQEIEAPKWLTEGLSNALKAGGAYGIVDAKGEIIKAAPNTFAIREPELRDLFMNKCSEMLNALKSASVPLPNRSVNVGETWKTQRTQHLYKMTEVFNPGPGGPGGPGPGGPGGRPGSGSKPKIKDLPYQEIVNCTYIGIRERGGRREAYIKLEGLIAPMAGAPASAANGLIKGFALVDLETGTVVESEITKDFTVDSSEGNIKRMISGFEVEKLSRSSN